MKEERDQMSPPNREISSIFSEMGNVSHGLQTPPTNSSNNIALSPSLCPSYFRNPTLDSFTALAKLNYLNQSLRSTLVKMATSILSRKKDLFYMIFFCMGLLSMLSMSTLSVSQSTSVFKAYSYSMFGRMNPTDCLPLVVDLQALYPPSMVPEFMVNIKAFYLNTYHDQFFVQTPPFFEFFMWTEIFFQGPVMLWGIGALLRGKEPPFSTIGLPVEFSQYGHSFLFSK